MNSNFFYRFLLLLTILFTSLSISYSAFPQFEFTDDIYDGGVVDVEGQISSGVELNLYVNNQFISKQDIILPQKIVELSSDLEDIEIGVAQTLKIINLNPDLSKTYKINISDKNIYKELDYLEQITFFSDVVGDISIIDEDTGIEKVISVIDKLNNFSFTDLQNDLIDGDNSLKFTYRYPLSTKTNSETKDFNVTYKKYYNKIFVTNFTNVSNQKSVIVQGTVQDVVSPLYYIINYGGTFSNIGQLNSVITTNGEFNFTINSGLDEGINNIRLITVDEANNNVFNGETRLELLVDTIDPTIIYSTDLKLKTNEANLILNISTDSVLINYTFNDNSNQVEVINNSVIIELNLDKGENSLVLEAIDIAGNTYKESHHIEFDDSKPKLLINDMKPEELFTGSHTAHFQFQSIEGKTNKGNVKVTVFAIPQDTYVYDESANYDDESRKIKVTCESYSSSFLRVKSPDEYEDNYIGDNVDDNQLSFSSLIFPKKTFTTDSDGNFGGSIFDGDNIIISLKSKTYDIIDDNNLKKSDEVLDVKSRNEICFQMEDEFGNRDIRRFDVTLDAGNTMWQSKEISTTPNTLYAAEIETGDAQMGSNGNQRFSMIGRFTYLGPGTVNSLASFRVTIDKASKDKNFKIITSEIQYVLDTQTNEMVVYIPVEILPLNIEPLEYQKSFEFGFQADVTYTVDDLNIPIDTKNPIYFKTEINIESPLDHTKWLTPKMIEKGQKFLNKSIEFTKQAKDIMGIASIVGVLSCTGAKFVYGAQIGMIEQEMKLATSPEDKASKLNDINNIKSKIYQICDRVFCSASPLDMDPNVRNNLKDNNILKLDPSSKDKNGNWEKTIFSDVDLNNVNIKSKSENGDSSLFDINSLSCSSSCDFNGDGGKKDGVYCTGKYQTYEDEKNGIWVTTQKSTTGKFVNKCYPIDSSTGKIDLSSSNSAYYQEGTPNFDETRCPTLGFGEPLKGWNPADNIIESVACGCISDTYSHLGNLLQIQEGIYKCLEQAKLGVVKGSYCERLLSQAVCDVATNVIFKTLMQESSRKDADGNEKERGLLDTLGDIGNGIKATDNDLSKRYDGNKFYSQLGFSQDQIVNKVCVAGISGDWSTLTDDILNSLDKNQVQPVFGPMVAESRMNGYNPLNGDLTIQYRFTYGVLSGGQLVDSEYTFICDPQSSDGGNCPTSGLLSSDDPQASQYTALKNVKYHVAAGQSRQDTIVLYDKAAKYWFNKIKVVHTFELNGKKETVTHEERIFHKGELTVGCYFSAGVIGAGSGFSCDTIFGEGSMISAYEIDDRTRIVPTSKTFYPGNKVFLDFYYDIREAATQGEKEFTLVGLASCQANSGTTKKLFYKDFTVDSTKQDNIATINYNPFSEKDLTSGVLGSNGRAIIDFMEIPALGIPKTTSVKYTLTIPSENLDEWNKKKGLYIKIIPTNEINNVEFSITNTNGFDLKNKNNFFRVKQNLQVNSGNNNHKKNFNISVKDNSISKQLYLELTDVVGTASIRLYDDTGSSIGFIKSPTGNSAKQSNEDFANLKAGKCDVSLRIVPKSQSDTITYDNFNSFNLTGQENLIKSSNLDTNGIKKLSFNIAKPRVPKSTNPNYYVELINPQPNTVICAKYNETLKQITKIDDLNIGIIGSAENDFTGSDSFKLKYSISLNSEGEIKSDNETLTKLKTDNYYNASIKLEQLIGSTSFEENDFKEGKFVYEIIQYKTTDTGKFPDGTKEKTIETNTIPIRISTGCKNSSRTSSKRR